MLQHASASAGLLSGHDPRSSSGNIQWAVNVYTLLSFESIQGNDKWCLHIKCKEYNKEMF